MNDFDNICVCIFDAVFCFLMGYMFLRWYISGAQLSGAHFATFSGRTVGSRTTGPRGPTVQGPIVRGRGLFRALTWPKGLFLAPVALVWLRTQFAGLHTLLSSA